MPPSSTNVSTTDPATRKAWAKYVWHAAMKRTVLLNSGMGLVSSEGDKGMVCQKTDLEKDAGDQVTVTLIHQLQGAGKRGQDILEGQEEGLDFGTDTLTVDKLRHGVKTWGEIVEQRVTWDTMKEAKVKLADWYASRFDIAGFTHLCGWTAAGMSKYVDQGGGQIDGSNSLYTGLNAVVAPDAQHTLRAKALATDQAVQGDTTATFDVGLVDEAVTLAKVLPVPLRPIRTSHGGQYFVLWLHPYHVRDLRQSSSDWYATAQNALQGGQHSSNPLFTGALGLWNGCILRESYYVSPGVHSTTGAGLENTRRAVLTGAQALLFAHARGRRPGEKMTWYHDSWDHGDKYYASLSSIWGMKASRFKEPNGSTVRDLSKIVITAYAKDAL